MSRIEIIPEERFVTAAWSGGTTTELFIFPEGSSYQERRFGFRISSALVELESSVFTRLEGVKRYLTPLGEGFLLNVNGRDVPLKNGEVLEFSGEDDVVCFGSGRDLNLMLKGYEGSMKLVSGLFRVYDSAHAFAFAPSGAELCSGDETASLPAGGFARLSVGEYLARGRIALFLVGGLTNEE
ncbi:MAG: HutD family protein [Clostridia bacterium]|nr:HutD family protein [Clostridia bacterium]